MAARVPWYADLPAAAATVPCGGQVHAVIWRDGEFQLPDHPDLEAERALAALAGEIPRCLELHAAWQRHRADPLVLERGPVGHRPSSAGSEASVRPASHRRLSARQRRIARAYAGLPRGAILTPPPLPVRLGAGDDLDALLELEGALPHRLVATVAAALDGPTPPSWAWAALRAGLDARVRPVVERWSRELSDFVLELSPHERGLELTPEGTAVLRLPAGWIHEVWARELDTLDGQLVLEARPRGDGILDLRCLDHDLEVHDRTWSERGWAE